MQKSTNRSVVAKLALGTLVLALSSVLLLGCNVDEKPSKMIQGREQMMQQRKASDNGNTLPSAPPKK